jgi:small subunit ribosomal protein S17
MTEEPGNTSEEQERVAEETPAVDETPAAEETPAQEAPADEPAAEESPADEAPADEPAAEAAPAAAAEAEPSGQGRSDEGQSDQESGQDDPTSTLSPKDKRRRDRATATGPAKPQRSPEERQAEREERRRKRAAVRRSTRVRARTRAAERRAAAPATEAPELGPKASGKRKVRQGVVVSAKPDKTITVRIDVARRHPRYEKILRSSTTLHAHDETNDANEGDVVRIIESRPLSRTKRWRLVEVVERAR